MKRRALPVIVVILLILILGGIFGAKVYFEKYSYSKEVADSYAYFGTEDPQDVPVMLGNEMIGHHARLFDGVLYFGLDMVQELLSDRFYVGSSSDPDVKDIMIYCLPTDRITTSIGSSEWTSSGSGTVQESYALTRSENGTIWLAADYVKRFAKFSYSYYSEPNRIRLVTGDTEEEFAVVKRDTQVRITGGIKSEILREIPEGEKVAVLDQMENWTKVRTDDCYIGYIENKRLGDPVMEERLLITDYTEPEFSTVRLPGKVNMVWHNVAGAAGNDTIYDWLAPTKALNVVAPTWFWILDDNGNMSSFATQSYVDYLHGQGIQVWATVDNFNAEGVSRNQFLTTLERRTNLISRLVSEAETFGIDGINVDFEQVDAAYGQDYIEFIRELSIECRKSGLILSVDNYVPYNFNEHYNLKEQGVFADYVVIMGYDEHYAGSQEAGSVASISYVSYGIQKALGDVPAEKLINAVPFYTRIWSTTAQGVSSQAVGMADAQQYVANHAMEVRWDDASGQNYASLITETERLEVWLEDAQSIETKLSVMEVNHLAGVAAWRLAFETPDVWDVIEAYVNR